jgi:hypothetical protein
MIVYGHYHVLRRETKYQPSRPIDRAYKAEAAVMWLDIAPRQRRMQNHGPWRPCGISNR